jgi:hypothetical protein
MSGRTQGPTPRGVHRPVVAPPVTALAFEENATGGLTLTAGAGIPLRENTTGGLSPSTDTTRPVRAMIALGQRFAVV